MGGSRLRLSDAQERVPGDAALLLVNLLPVRDLDVCGFQQA
jgi:hypothetical protein